MSVICAIRNKNGTWIASNTTAVLESGRNVDGGPLWHCANGWAVGQTGDARTGSIIEFNKEDLFTDLAEGFDFTERLRRLLEKHGYSGRIDSDSSAPCYGSSYLLTNGEKLWDIDVSLDITEYSAGAMAARGSGAPYALGVGSALKGEKPKLILEMAVQAAMKYDVVCGGEVWIKRVAKSS